MNKYYIIATEEVRGGVTASPLYHSTSYEEVESVYLNEYNESGVFIVELEKEFNVVAYWSPVFVNEVIVGFSCQGFNFGENAVKVFSKIVFGYVESEVNRVA